MNICKREDFGDKQIEDHVSLVVALVLQRDGDDNHAIVRTNVPHLVVHHSPNGYEFGYGGSGPADLALNICQFYLKNMGCEGEKTQCFDGDCYSLAWVLHQGFERAFIEPAPRQGIIIPMVEIKQWFEEHITEDMKSMYAVQEQETE